MIYKIVEFMYSDYMALMIITCTIINLITFYVENLLNHPLVTVYIIIIILYLLYYLYFKNKKGKNEHKTNNHNAN